jgi:hypothetical protein
MTIMEQKDSYTAVVRTTLPNGVKNFRFTGLQRNKSIGSSKIVTSLDGAKITIPKNILDEGIARFTLCDSKDLPLSERLVFVEKNSDHPVVTVSAPKKREYGKRELVELEIISDSTTVQKFHGSVSVSELSYTENNVGPDIRTYLLLSSDLRGEIEQPGYYLYADDPQRKALLDLLMMTQGCKQFILNDSLIKNMDKLKFAAETGINIGGTIRRYSMSGKPAKADVSLVYSMKDKLVYSQTETDNQGHFLFDSIDFNDSTSVIIQAKNVKKGKDESSGKPNEHLCITLDSVASPEVSMGKNQVDHFTQHAKRGYPEKSLMTDEADSIRDGQQRHILLQQVTVATTKIERMAKKRSIYFEPSHYVDFKEIRNGTAARNILEALEGRIAGTEINGGEVVIGGTGSILFGGDPLFLLDGMPVSKGAILSVPVNQVDFVDVLKRSRAAVFGPSGSHGVIAIYTLTAADNLANVVKNKDNCIINFVHPGFSIGRKFQEPVYSPVQGGKSKIDNRSTIYWNPAVMPDHMGRCKISFYTSDLPATYKVDLQGLTPEGVPFKSETFIEVKSQ